VKSYNTSYGPPLNDDSPNKMDISQSENEGDHTGGGAKQESGFGEWASIL
jgi:hypothetical protein